MNCNTQNEKIASITSKTLVVGIDVGSETHYARAFNYRGYEFSKKPLAFSNDEAGFKTFKDWMDDIAEKNHMNQIFPGMEPTGHYWFNLAVFLQNNGMKVLHVNPHHVKKSKELDDNNPSKNDRKDPKVIAGLINEGRFTYPYIPIGVYAEVREYSNQRMHAQEELTRVKNRIARWFSIHFPEYKDVYNFTDAASGMAILKVAPLPCDIVELGKDGIVAIWRDLKMRAAGEKRAEKLLEAATHSVGSKEAPEAARQELFDLFDDYEKYSKRVDDLMQKLTEKMQEIKYIDKLLEIKGIGIVTASTFIAEVGDIGRFDNPKQIQKLAGFAIVADSSGKHKGESRISYRGRKHLRYALYEAAVSVTGKNAEFNALHKYFTTRDRNPLKKMQSMIAIACKLIRIFYTILTKGVTYDGKKMMNDIVRPDLEVA